MRGAQVRTNRGAQQGGAHRRQSSPKFGKVATVAVAAGAVGAAGIAGAGAAHASGTNVRLVANDAPAAPAADNAAPETLSPQILELPQAKPLGNISDQLAKAVEFNKQRVAEDAASRAPQIVKPAEGTLTTGFEMRWGSFHKGIDIANALGTPEIAVVDATVIDAGPASGFGQWVRLRADDGTVLVYGHMETINVTVGQRVKAGDVIAGMGSRGFSTGSHLHFEVHPNGGEAIDPIPWLAERGISYGEIQR